MQILRAVLRWNGVVIPGNPLGRETAGRDRITITAARGDPVPIPPELLGVVARCREGTVASRFGLLPLPATDRVSRRRDPRAQVAQVPKSEAQLRAGWQAGADFVVGAARRE